MMDFVEDDELYEHFRIEVDKGQVPVRIDKYLSCPYRQISVGTSTALQS